MSRPKPLHRYPEEYYELLKKAQQTPMTIHFRSAKQARAFRVELYLFRTALRKALLANPNSETLQIQALFAEELTFSIEDTDLRIAKKESIHTQTLRDQL